MSRNDTTSGCALVDRLSDAVRAFAAEAGGAGGAGGGRFDDDVSVAVFEAV